MKTKSAKLPNPAMPLLERLAARFEAALAALPDAAEVRAIYRDAARWCYADSAAAIVAWVAWSGNAGTEPEGWDGATKCLGDELTAPKKGDWSVCAYCAAILRFEDNGALRELAEGEAVPAEVVRVVKIVESNLLKRPSRLPS